MKIILKRVVRRGKQGGKQIFFRGENGEYICDDAISFIFPNYADYTSDIVLYTSVYKDDLKFDVIHSGNRRLKLRNNRTKEEQYFYLSEPQYLSLIIRGIKSLEIS